MVVLLLTVLSALWWWAADRAYNIGYARGFDEKFSHSFLKIPPEVSKVIVDSVAKGDPNMDTLSEIEEALDRINQKLKEEGRTIHAGDKITMQCGLVPGRQKGNMECVVVMIR